MSFTSQFSILKYKFSYPFFSFPCFYLQTCFFLHSSLKRSITQCPFDESVNPTLKKYFCKVLNANFQFFMFSSSIYSFGHFRDLPQYGHKQWQAYFGRTFDIYTKLWKFQQQHRLILDTKYGLKRWQIGEIASKIGQLYYHYQYVFFNYPNLIKS